MDQVYFPPASNIMIVFGCFVVLLIFLDLLLVRWLKLSKKAWKQVDYIWLFFATIGLVSASSEVRFFVSSSALNLLQERALTAYDSFHSSITDSASEPGYVCRKFVKTEYSPPEPEFSNVQKEFDMTCTWLQTITKKLPTTPLEQEQIQLIYLPNTQPLVKNTSLLDLISGVHEQLDYYNEIVKEIEELQSKNQQSDLDKILMYLSPWLLAFALALRITKVTGELKYES